MSEEKEGTPELDRVREEVDKEISSGGISDSLRIEGIEIDKDKVRRTLDYTGEKDQDRPDQPQDNGQQPGNPNQS